MRNTPSKVASPNCVASNDCESTDFDQLGTVDANDLAIFVDSWLTGVKLIKGYEFNTCSPSIFTAGTGEFFD